MWKKYIAPGLDYYMGLAFESICREFCRLNKTLPFQPVQIGEWWSSSADDQMDVVVIGADGELLLVECKWRGAGITDLNLLQRRADLIMPKLKGGRSVQFALFTGRAVSKTVQKGIEKGRVLHFPLEAFFCRRRDGARPQFHQPTCKSRSGPHSRDEQQRNPASIMCF